MQFVRFVAVGVLNTGFAYAAYAGFLWLGLRYAAASLGALLLGVLFSFRTQGALVFGNTDVRRLGRFAACWAAIYAVNVGLIGALMGWGLNAYWAGAVALPPVTVLSYLVQKFVVFGAARAGRSGQP